MLFTFALMREISEVLAQARTDNAVRVLVITGNGRAFCAGADLKEAAGVQASAKAGDQDFLDVVREAFDELRAFPKPVIAAVNGLALAGGMELVMACDLVFAAQSARIGDAHSKFGVFPGAGGAAIMPGRIGMNRAKYLLLAGDHFSATEMMEMGLVNRVTPDAGLVAEVDAFVAKLAQKSPRCCAG